MQHCLECVVVVAGGKGTCRVQTGFISATFISFSIQYAAQKVESAPAYARPSNIRTPQNVSLCEAFCRTFLRAFITESVWQFGQRSTINQRSKIGIRRMSQHNPLKPINLRHHGEFRGVYFDIEHLIELCAKWTRRRRDNDTACVPHTKESALGAGPGLGVAMTREIWVRLLINYHTRRQVKCRRGIGRYWLCFRIDWLFLLY